MADSPTNRVSIEELANSVTQAIGMMFSLVGFIVPLVLAVMLGSAWHIAICAIYGSTPVCLYTCPSPNLWPTVKSTTFRRAPKLNLQ